MLSAPRARPAVGPLLDPGPRVPGGHLRTSGIVEDERRRSAHRPDSVRRDRAVPLVTATPAPPPALLGAAGQRPAAVAAERVGGRRERTRGLRSRGRGERRSRPHPRCCQQLKPRSPPPGMRREMLISRPFRCLSPGFSPVVRCRPIQEPRRLRTWLTPLAASTDTPGQRDVPGDTPVGPRAAAAHRQPCGNSSVGPNRSARGTEVVVTGRTARHRPAPEGSTPCPSPPASPASPSPPPR